MLRSISDLCSSKTVEFTNVKDVVNLVPNFVHLEMDQAHVQETLEDPYFCVKMEGERCVCITDFCWIY